MDIEPSIARLREGLLADERIATAILFGSAAKGFARPASDLDVGLIARSAADLAALDNDKLGLAAKLELAAGREIDVVLLERADPVLGRQVFAYGRTLFDRAPERTADVLERILIEYFDGEYHRRLAEEALESRRAARLG